MKFLTFCALMIFLLGNGSASAQAVTPANIRAVSQTETGIAFYGVNDLHELVQVGSLPVEFAFYGAETEAKWQISGLDKMQVSPDGQQVVFSARHLIGEMEYHGDQMNDLRTAYFYEHGVFIYSDGQNAIDQIWQGYSWAGQIADPSWSPDGKHIGIRPRGLDGGDEFPPDIPTTIYTIADRSFSEIGSSRQATWLFGLFYWIPTELDDKLSGLTERIRDNLKAQFPDGSSNYFLGFPRWVSSNQWLYFTSCTINGNDQCIDTIYSADLDGNIHLELFLPELDGVENVEYSRVVRMYTSRNGMYVLTETMTYNTGLHLRIIQINSKDKQHIIWEQNFPSGVGFSHPYIEGIISPDFNQILITGIDYIQSDIEQEFFVVDLTTGLQTFDNFEVAGETCAAQWLDSRYLLFEQNRVDNEGCQHLWRTPFTDVWLADSVSQTITQLEVENGDSIWLIPRKSQP